MIKSMLFCLIFITLLGCAAESTRSGNNTMTWGEMEKTFKKAESENKDINKDQATTSPQSVK